MARALTQDELALLSRMRGQINRNRRRNVLRNQYDDGEHRLDKLPVSIPTDMQDLRVPVGWPDKACTARASRMRPSFYSIRNSSTLLDDVEAIFADNQWQYLERQAIRSAIRHGVSFIFSHAGNPAFGEPDVVMSVRDALHATAILDPRSRRTVAALEIVDRHVPIGGFDTSMQLMYLPGKTLQIERNGDGNWRVTDEWDEPNRVLCTPYVHDGSLQRPLGRSAISRVLMGLTDLGVRTLMRFESTSEFYSAPRTWIKSAIAGMFDNAPDDSTKTGWEHVIGASFGLPELFDEETGEVIRPELQQLPQASMQPLADGFRMIAAAVSGETAVPVHYLGVVQDSNPTSAEAIYANEVDLVNLSIYLRDSFNVGRTSLVHDVLTAAYGDLDSSARADLSSLVPRWEDPRTRSVQEQSQFVAQQVQIGNFQPGSETTLRQLPIAPEDVPLFVQEARDAQGASRVTAMLNQLAEQEGRAGQTSEPIPPATTGGPGTLPADDTET